MIRPSTESVCSFLNHSETSEREVIWPNPEEMLFSTRPVFALIANRVHNVGQVSDAVENFREFAERLDRSHRDLTVVASTTAISQAAAFRHAAESTDSDFPDLRLGLRAGSHQRPISRSGR